MGLDAFAFAAALGVHVSTVYRWEKKGTTSMDDLQYQIISSLNERLKHSKSDMIDLGDRIRAKLSAGGGTLVGLHTVLSFLIK